jgi:hypothetical protein
MGLLDFHNTYKIVFGVHLKHPSSWPSADPRPISNDLVHARPQQCIQGLNGACKVSKVHARPQQCMQGFNRACKAWTVHARPRQCKQGFNSACKASAMHARLQQCMQFLNSACKASTGHARPQQCMPGLNRACFLSVLYTVISMVCPREKSWVSITFLNVCFSKPFFQLLAALGCKGFFYNVKLNGPL